MKKIVLTVVALLSMTMTFAENESSNATDVYSMKINMKSLSAFLGLNDRQKLDVSDINTSLCNDIMEARNFEGAEKQEIIKEALEKNCKYMHKVLDSDQYNKYLRVLNATINNRGLNK